jgi:Tol biopolymer transport system component
MLVAFVGLAGEAIAQPVPPNAGWRTIESDHFRVTFAPGLDSLAGHAAMSAERAYRLLASLVSRPPSGTIDILVTDHVDSSNGTATPIPSNRIVVWAKPPVDQPALAYNRDWIELVVVHELAHIFHLDRSGRFGMALRRAFGRVPSWPLFSALGTPGWSIEGLAVVAESELTGAGRAHGSYHDMVVRTAVLRDSFDQMDRLNGVSPLWPGGQRVYIYGSLFMEYLTERYGSDAMSELVDRTASAVLPPALFWDRVAKRAFGVTFDEAYADWQTEVRTRVTRLADSLRVEGLTEGERLTEHPWYAMHARLSPDGERLAYAAADGRTATATRVVDASTGERLWSERRNGLGGHGWLPDGSGLVVSQIEYTSAYHLRQDLHVVSRSGARRLTSEARLQDPDVAGDGARIVAIENDDGMNRLAIVEIATGEVRGLTAFEPAVLWAFPRWSPDGTHIAAARWLEGGEHDVVVLDTTGQVVARLTHDAAIDTQPAWSSDGQWILFSSDRSGIPNLYAAAVEGAAAGAPGAAGRAAAEPGAAAVTLRQVTNVLTGAFHPDVSSDNRWIYYSEYDDDGFHLARIPFDPATWRDPAPVRIAENEGSTGVASQDRAAAAAENGDVLQTVQLSETRGYSPFATLRPTSWAPIVFADDALGTFYGAASGGIDLVGSLAWGASLAVDPDDGRWQGYAAVDVGLLGNPRFTATASREWEDAGLFRLEDGTTASGVEREDIVGLFANLVRPRIRNSAVVALGVERTFRRRSVDGAPGLAFRDAEDDLINLVARVGFANYRGQPFSISREDGISLTAAVERELERNGHPDFPRDQTELTARALGYKALHPFGFANHVVALRAGALVRMDDGASPQRIGGTSGSVLEVAGLPFVSAPSLLLPVRGFDRGVRWGTRAWTASAEYRMPIAIVGRRPPWSPLFIDRISASAFADTGDAWCADDVAERFGSACGVLEDGTLPDPAPLVSAGSELILDLGLAAIAAARVRLGVVFPIQGPESEPRLYIQLGSSF